MTDALDPLLRHLADADAAIEAPPHVERAVMQAWDSAHAPAPGQAHRNVRAHLAWLVVPAAAVLVAAIVAFDSTNRNADPLATPDARGGPDRRRLDDSDWYVLVHEPAAGADGLSVVRLRMSRRALASLGVPVPDPDAAALVDVDVVLGEDGVARAFQPVTLVGFIEESPR